LASAGGKDQARHRHEIRLTDTAAQMDIAGALLTRLKQVIELAAVGVELGLQIEDAFEDLLINKLYSSACCAKKAWSAPGVKARTFFIASIVLKPWR
jgi:hypothetical protein